MSNASRWTIGLVAVLACSAVVQANSVQLRFSKVSPRKIAKVHLAGSPFDGRRVYVGRYQTQIKDPVGSEAEALFYDLQSDPSQTLTLDSWCIDVHEHETSSFSTYTLVPLEDAPLWSGSGSSYDGMGTQKAQDLKNLFGQFYPQVQADSDNADLAAAFGAAIWEIVNESGNSYGVWDGSYTMSNGGSWLGTADDWLDDLDGETLAEGVSVLARDGSQDFTFYVPTPDPPQDVVPEPLTMLAVGSAVAGLGGYIRRRRRDA
jgi:hypothetical protein